MTLFWLAAAHSVCCVLLAALFSRRFGGEEYWYHFTVMLCIPAAGFLFFALSALLGRLPARASGEEELYSRSLERYAPKLLVRGDEAENAADLVPANDALLLNENSVRRKIIIGLAKKNSPENIAILKEALANRDTEVSHYAAASIGEMKNFLAADVREKAVGYEKDKNSVESLKAYVAALRTYLKSGLSDERARRRCGGLYEARLADLLKACPEEEAYFAEKIDFELETKEYSAAQEDCMIFSRAFPNSEKPYLELLELYYSLHAAGKFRQTLEGLRRSGIPFSRECLNIYRFWTDRKEDA